MEKLTDLQQAVIEQMGYDELSPECAATLKDVMKSPDGAAAGFNGFIYYSETCKFFEDNKDLIMQQLIEDRWSIGYNSLTEMLKSFNCFKDVDTYNIEQFLINSDDESNEDETTLKNGLAWYCLEDTAYRLEETIEEILNNDETEEA